MLTQQVARVPLRLLFKIKNCISTTTTIIITILIVIFTIFVSVYVVPLTGHLAVDAAH